MRWARTLSILAAALIAFEAPGAEAERKSGFTARTWRTEHGLPHRQIRDLHQSRDGYIWAATPAGLVRFDGHDFDVLNRTAHPELPDENFSSVTETSDGSLWAGTAAGLARWLNGKLTVYTECAGVRALNAAPDGSLFIATTNGVVRFAKERFQRFTTEDGLSGIDIRAAAIDADGAIWAAPEHWLYEGALNRMRPGESKFAMVGAAGLNEMVHSMALDSDGRFWWGDNLGLRMWHQGKQRHIPKLDAQSSSVVSRVKPARRGVVAVVSPRSEYRGRAGVFLVGAGTEPERVDTPELQQPTVAIQDFEDAIWVGTREDGLWQLQRKAVTTWRTTDGLAHDFVAGVFPHRGGVVALTERAAVAIRTNGDEPSDVTPPEYFSGAVPTMMCELGGGAELLAINPRGHVHTSLNGQWRDETAWAGFAGQGAAGAGKPTSSDHFAIHMLCGISAGTIVARADRVAIRLHAGTWITNAVAVPRGITAMRSGRDGSVLIAASGKLHDGTFLVSNNTLIFRPTRVFSTPSPETTRILGIEVSEHGTIWLATDRGLGVVLGDAITLLTTKHSLPTDSIYSVLEDNRGGVWLGCNRGLIHAVKEDVLRAARQGGTAEFVLLREAEGMPTSETIGGYDGVACRTADGRLWFGTAKGLVEADPTREVHNRFRPHVVIEKALIDYTPATNGIRLAPGRGRTVEFHFTGTSLADPSRARFRYMLEGVDKSWREESRREAVYTLLGAGDYTFRVIALNNHGAPSLQPATFQFSVAPYFWQTNGFRFACAGMVALTALGWHRRRLAIGRRIQALEHERELQSERARIARDMHDDLGAGLARVALLSDLAAREHEAAPTRQLRTISRQLIRSLDEIVWAVHPGKDNSEELISYLAESAQEFLADGPVSLRLILPDSGETVHVPSRVRHSLVMALKEALHNVIKHSGAKTVSVRLDLQRSGLRMEITDDGQGLREGSRRGHGLDNMRQRIESVGGELQIYSSDQGLRLVAVVPLPAIKYEKFESSASQ